MLKSLHLFAATVLLSTLGGTTLSKCVQAAETKVGLSFELSPGKDRATKAPSGLIVPAVKESHEEVDVARSETGNRDIVPVPNAPIPVDSNTVDSNTLEYAQERLPPFPPELTDTERFKPKPVKPKLEQLADVKANSIGLRFESDEIAITDNTQTDLSSTSALSTPMAIGSVGSVPIASKSAISNTVDSKSISPKSASLEKVELSFETTDLDKVLSALNVETSASSTVPRSTDFDTSSKDKTASDGVALDDWMFKDGSNSLVARTVGSAEGTRHWSGDRTSAYYGHVDPGNGVWNLGTFSYQHGANSPEEADRRQLQRLKRQGHQIQEQATRLGIQLSLEEKLNAIDLANQAPLAALDKGGYVERLAQARQLEMKGEDAILWARTYAYLDPDTRDWNAPGLGNNVHSISRDQERRIIAISRALKAYTPNEKKGEKKRSDPLANLQRISLEDNDLGGIELGGIRSPRFSRTNTLSTQSSATQDTYNNTRSNKLDSKVSFELPARGLQANNPSIIGRQSTIGKQPTVSSSRAPSLEASSPKNDVPVITSSSVDESVPMALAERTAVNNAKVFDARGAKDSDPSTIPPVNSSIDSSLEGAEDRVEAFSSDTNKSSGITDESNAIKSQTIAGTSNADRLNTDRLKVSSDNKAAQRRLKMLQQDVLPRESADIENTATESLQLYRIENRVLP